MQKRKLRPEDIAARIPFGMEFFDESGRQHKATSMNCVGTVSDGNNYYDIDDIKPFLYGNVPERLRTDYEETLVPGINEDGDIIAIQGVKTIEFCIANHIDYTGLVKDGLAIDRQQEEQYDV